MVPTSTPDQASRPNVLCIEDEWETASLLQEELVDRGYRVRLAHSGGEGLNMIQQAKPDIVLCDINMPVLSGFDVLDRLTQLGPRFAGMPFVFLTALSGREAELKGRQLGADDYVTKPIDYEVLDAILRARLAGVARLNVWRRQAGLSARELEALTWAARGKTSEEIAQIVGLSRRTIDFHLESARARLGVATRTEAVATAVAARLIEL